MEFKLISPVNSQLSITEQVLVNRGIPQEQVEHYLNTTDDDILPLSLIPHLKEAASMLIKHIANNDQIFIQVDSDCDGYTSAALLINYLNRLFPAFVQNNISYRLHTGKQHGLVVDAVPETASMIILPDSSSNDYEEHKTVYKKGIDVLVIDHHIAEYESPYAITINNQLCEYPNKTLSGVGMVYKFCCYLDQLLEEDIADDFLDLVALGEIADVMDLKEFETRQIINKGLLNIKNPYIKTKVAQEEYSLSGKLTPIGVAFYIAPSINAITRSGSDEEKRTVFESMLEYKAYDKVPSTKRGCSAGATEIRVEQACRYCANAKSRQTKIRDAALETCIKKIEDNNLLDNKVIIISDCCISPNLTGLVATQIADLYKRPTLILNKTEKDGNFWYEGSGRNFENSPLKDFRGSIEKVISFMGIEGYAQGHESAFGCGVLASKMHLLNYSLNECLNKYSFSPIYLVDYIYEASTLDANNIKQIASLKPYWGQGVKEALVAITNLNVHKDNISLLKGNTIKITLKEKNIELIKFRSSEEEYEKLFTNSGCVTLNIVGSCQINSWGYNETAQINITDYEIMSRTAYYF